jgi:hypothetical protein
MEQQQRSLVFTAAVGLIILAIIVGSIYYLVKFIQGRVSSSRQTVQTQTQQAASTSATVSNGNSGAVNITPTGSPASSSAPQNRAPQTGGNTPAAQNQPASGKKVYNAGDFQLTYPNTWGIAKCSNSKNFEFDPQNPADSSIVCDLATKAVTVVVSDIKGCEGETSKVGNIDVVKSQANDGGYIKYQWCTKTTPVLNITHRVSQDGERATSKQDFSKQIEDMISNLSLTRGS